MNPNQQLGLRPGDWVEVRSAEEILATLDEQGTLDGLVFMPEMLTFCGRRLQVYARADKTCDTIDLSSMMRMYHTVHLRGARCCGTSHGECQATCLLFWKESWLRMVRRDRQAEETPRTSPVATAGSSRDQAWLELHTIKSAADSPEPHFRCQATELKAAAFPIEWWYPAQYLRDRINGISLWMALRSLLLFIYNRIHLRIGGRPFPHVAGSLKRTPSESLELRVGEWVVVKSRQEIAATLDTAGKNRGMTFEAEMLPYCGKRYRVVKRVEQIIDEATGRMKKLGSVGIILEEVICASAYRIPCPRANYLYWREIWLRRAGPDQIPKANEAAAECALQALTN